MRLGKLIEKFENERIHRGVFFDPLLLAQLLIRLQGPTGQFQSISQSRMIVHPLRKASFRPAHRLMRRSKVEGTATEEELKSRMIK